MKSIKKLMSLLFFTLIPTLVQAQSFDCRSAKRLDEVAICQNQDLAELDIQMSNAYFRLLNSLTGSDRDQLRSQQIEWLGERQDCGDDLDCLRTVYEERINELDNEGASKLAQPRP